MNRSLPVSVIFFCLCAVSVPAAEQRQNPSDAQIAALVELRHAAFDQWKQGNFEQAAESYVQILQLAETSPGPEFADDLHSMAVIESDLGRYEAAKEHYQRELNARREENNQAAAGMIYSSLGAILQIEGAFPEAETSYKNAVQLLTRYAGATDLRTASALNRLGWLYTLWGRTGEAGPLLQRACDAAFAALKEDDPRIIRFLDVRASFFAATGKYAQAERQWQKALLIGEKAYPHDDFQFDEVFLHLGQMYSVLGEYHSAEGMFQRFLAIKASAQHVDGVIRAVVTAELARVYTLHGNSKDAEPLFAHTIEMIESERSKVPVAYSLIHSYFGDYYMTRSKWSDAEAQYRSALEMRESMLGKTAPDVASSLLALSRALSKQHRKKEAEQYKSQGMSIAASQRDAFTAENTIDARAFRQN